MRSLRALYEWVLSWADSRYALPVLIVVSATESVFFPIPPDPLLMALALARPQRAYLYAAVCSASSVLGGALGYFIGFYLLKSVGEPIIAFYGVADKYQVVQEYYRAYDAWAVGIAGFTPIPYKVFTISAGAFEIDFLVFLIASALSRSARFFIEAALIHRFGPPIRSFIDRYFNLLTILFIVLLLGGFLLFKGFLQ